METMTTSLDTFFDAYVTAALWSSNDESDERGGVPLDQNYTAQDIAPDTLAKMREDCVKFLLQWIGVIDRAQEMDPSYTYGYAGVDFWLTRNGHGAGFWDRELGDTGETLTKAAQNYGEYNLYIGDDGMIHGG